MSDSRVSRNITLYYVTDFFNALLFTIPIWVAYQRMFLTFSQMSLVWGIKIFVALLFELPTGAFADVFGRKLSVFLGFMIQVVGGLIMAFARESWHIGVGQILNGIGDSFVSGALIALVYDTLKDAGQEKRFASIRSKGILLTQIGIIVSSFASGYLFVTWRGLPYVGEAIAFLVAGCIYLFMYEKRKSGAFVMKQYVSQLRIGITKTFRTGSTRDLSIFYILVGGLTWSWQTYFNQIYATSIGYTEIGKGWLFGIIRFVNAILIIRFLHLERYVTKRNMFLFFPGIILFSSLFTFIPFKSVGTAFLFTMTFAGTMRFAVLDTYVNEVFASHYRATALSTLNMFVRLIYIILVVISGPLLDRYPASVVYVLMGLFTLITILPRGIRLAKAATSSSKILVTH